MLWPFCTFNELFELFYFQGGMIVQNISSIISKNKNWVHKIEFIWIL